MINHLWINLPTSDLERSRRFYQHIGFKENENHLNDPNMLAITVGKVMVMIFPQNQFEGFVRGKTNDANNTNEVLFSIDADSPEEIDAYLELIETSEGKVYGKPGWVDGWMYGMGFSDPDGHKWNFLYMKPQESR